MNERTITEEQWLHLKDQTRDTALAILVTCDAILKQMDENHLMEPVLIAMCTGLYTHSVEEYGKLILLQCHLPVDGKVIINYNDEFKNHKVKFGLALKNMPSSCKTLHSGNFDSRSFSDDFDIDTTAEWNTRLEIFNTDIDQNGNVKPYPTIDLEKLKQAVNDFQVILWQTIPNQSF
ncbi:MAG: hypothetical protein IIC67_06125 [Thaumarchaeota archaeon]|nr:hypothetical protein [Nitrososphaerota archaeon]